MSPYSGFSQIHIINPKITNQLSASVLGFWKSADYQIWLSNLKEVLTIVTIVFGVLFVIVVYKLRKLIKEKVTELKTEKISMSWGGSSLLDKNSALPSGRKPGEIKSKGIPSTYVPARNTIFLSIAASYAEAIRADAIFIGAHFEDSSGYPDCRKAYLEAFNRVIKIGTKRGLEKRLELKFPLINKAKKDIIMLGHSLGVPFQYTWSCYRGARRPCGKCDSCVLRAKGFKEAKLKDSFAG